MILDLRGSMSHDEVHSGRHYDNSGQYYWLTPADTTVNSGRHYGYFLNFGRHYGDPALRAGTTFFYDNSLCSGRGHAVLHSLGRSWFALHVGLCFETIGWTDVIPS